MPDPTRRPPLPALRGRRVLLVEDEYLLAKDVGEELERQGALVLGPVPSVTEALDLLASDPPPDAAILDINLGGEMVYPVAEALRACAIPFIFTTGYEAEAILPAYAGVPRAEKPLAPREVVRLLSL